MNLNNHRKIQVANSAKHCIDLSYKKRSTKNNNFRSIFACFFSLGQRKVWMFLLILCFVFGPGLVNFFSETIRALNIESEVVNLYVDNCGMEYDIGDSDDEWQFMENLKNEANVFDKGPSFLFSDKNSALYKGGDRSLVCSDFSGVNNIENIENVKIKFSLAIFDSNSTSREAFKKSTSTDDIYNILSDIIGTTTVGTTTAMTSTTTISTTTTSTTTTTTSTTTTENEDTSTTTNESDLYDDFSTSTTEYYSTTTESSSTPDFTASSSSDAVSTSTAQSDNSSTESGSDEDESSDANTDEENSDDSASDNMSEDDESEEEYNGESEDEENNVNEENDNKEDSSNSNESDESAEETSSDESGDKDPSDSATEEESTNNESNNETEEPVSVKSILNNTIDGLAAQLDNFFNLNKVFADDDSEQAKIILQYSFNDSLWHDLGEINSNNISNAINNGYFSYNASFLEDFKDIKDLRTRIKTEGILENNLVLYIDSVWLEVEYENEGLQEVQNEDELTIGDGEEEKIIKFEHTDDNTDENLIIKTDRKDYNGLSEIDIYFNIKNISSKNQVIDTQFYFPNYAGELTELKKLKKDIVKTIKTPMFAPKLYRCDEGWIYINEENKDGGIDSYYKCEKTEKQEECNELSDDNVICYVPKVKIGTEDKEINKDQWDNIELFTNEIGDKQGFVDKIFGLDYKKIEDSFKIRKSSFKEGQNESVLNKIIDSIKSIGTKDTENEKNILKSGETQYYMAKIKFPVSSNGEFYIEAIGDNGGYGLLDPWWESDWNYRMPIEIDNSSASSSLSDYQIFLEFDSGDSDFWDNVKSDGGDVRFLNSDQDTALDYWIQNWNYASTTANIWVQINSIPSATTSEIFMYYGNNSATTTSDQYDPFTYSSMEDLFYVVTNESGVSVEVVSLIDGNQVQLDGQTAVNLDRQELTTFSSVGATSTLRAKGPVHAKVTGDDNVDALVPISFAAKQFAIASTRGTENFHSYAPFTSSTVTIYDATMQEQQQTVNEENSWTVSNEISTMAIVESTKPILLSFDNSTPADGFVPYPATNKDLYGISSTHNYIGIAENSSFNVYCSGSSSASVGTQSRGVFYDNTTCGNGSQGTADAVRLTNISGKIGALQQADSDGGESSTFLPAKEFSSEYMVSTEAQYLAIACAPESGSMEISVFNESNTFVASSTCAGSGEYPGKTLFNSGPYNAGTRIVSNNSNKTFYIYYEDSSGTNDDENNLWGAVQSRKYVYNHPSYTIKDEEPLKAPLATINSVNQDGLSGTVNFSVDVSDESNDEVKIKVEYVATSTCNFASSSKPVLATSSISATYGSPAINNNELYQIGTTSNMVITKNGTNTIEFDWNTINDLSDKEGVYCVKITANDGFEDQLSPATSTVEIDNVDPVSAGGLSLDSKDGSSITLSFGASASDEFFDEYKIFYKETDGSPVDENDSVHSSSTDTNLGYIDYNNATTTTISGLIQGTEYIFNIWVYDKYGHLASSSQELTVIANKKPLGYFNSAVQKIDGSGVVDISIEVEDDDGDESKVKIEYEAGSSCNFISTSTLSLDTNNVDADIGLPVIDNDEEYQVGTSSGWIVTSVGANTIGFDWLSYLDEPSADNSYCLRLLVNDGIEDQISYATTTLIVDNVLPVATGDLNNGGTTADSVKLMFATSSPAVDTNEPSVDAYKIFYKQGTSSVSINDIEYDDSALNFYNYNGKSSTTVTGLNSGMDYVFNIWTYDEFGAMASSSETTIKTDSSLKNDSLTFVNNLSKGTSTNILVNNDENVWNFRAEVSETNGWQKIDEVYLSLADNVDNLSPFGDLEFKWSQSSNVFSEIGLDVNESATLSNLSSSDCTSTLCILDFKFILNKDFASTTIDYSAELFSTNDIGKSDSDTFLDFYQARKSWIGQMHYRWRNDNGAQ